MNSLRDEWLVLMTGKTMPYHKIALTVVLVITVLFSVIFYKNQIFEGPVAIIDLDHSRYSQEVIEKLSASPYIHVIDIVNTPVDPEIFFFHDRAIAVIYLPEGLEKNRYSRVSTPIGMVLDNTNVAQTVNIRGTVNEIIATENHALGIPQISALGVSGEQSAALMSTLSVQERILYNPNNSSSGTTVINFLYFFLSMFLAIAMLMIVGRLRVSNQWEKQILEGSPLSLFSRLLPYMAIFIAVMTCGMGALKFFSDFRFAGSCFGYIASLCIYTASLGVICMLLSWTAKHPGEGANRMILIIPPGFILGGANMARDILPEWVQAGSYLSPLTWQFGFLRDVAFRGVSLEHMTLQYGAFLLYALAFFILFAVFFYRERAALLKTQEKKKTNHQQLDPKATLMEPLRLPRGQRLEAFQGPPARP